MNDIRFRLRILVTALGFTVAFGVGGFMALEGLTFVDALYFTVVTVATVGYGDIHPVTDAGKLVAVVMIVTGVGTFLGVFANAAELLLARRQDALRRERLLRRGRTKAHRCRPVVASRRNPHAKRRCRRRPHRSRCHRRLRSPCHRPAPEAQGPRRP